MVFITNAYFYLSSSVPILALTFSQDSESGDEVKELMLPGKKFDEP